MDQKDKTRVVSAIRKTWRWSAERRDALKAFSGVCDKCGDDCLKKDVSVDHIVPVVAITGAFYWEDWHAYVTRMFPGVKGYWLLCAECHRKKTMAERGARVLARKVRHKET